LVRRQVVVIAATGVRFGVGGQGDHDDSTVFSPQTTR
jgi:hypothetical protein